MTLSRFLRDYIYIPLGGNRQGEFRTYINLFTTFLLGGLWHGAGWTFIFWGTLHGLALMIHRSWKSFGFSMNRYLAWFITFNFVNLTWIFFRAKEWSDAIKVISGMLGLKGVVISDKELSKLKFLKEWIITHPENFGRLIHGTTTFVLIIMMTVCVVRFQNSNEMLKTFKPSWKVLFLVAISVIYILFDMSKVSEFLYFNF